MFVGLLCSVFNCAFLCVPYGSGGVASVPKGPMTSVTDVGGNVGRLEVGTSPPRLPNAGFLGREVTPNGLKLKESCVAAPVTRCLFPIIHRSRSCHSWPLCDDIIKVTENAVFK